MTNATEDLRESEQTVRDYEEVLADKRRLAREIDIALHGVDGAAKQTALCDLIEPAKALRARAEKAERERDEALHVKNMDGETLTDPDTGAPLTWPARWRRTQVEFIAMKRRAHAAEAALSRIQSSDRGVTDEMMHRAWLAAGDAIAHPPDDKTVSEVRDRAMRAALEAALSSAPGQGWEP